MKTVNSQVYSGVGVGVGVGDIALAVAIFGTAVALAAVEILPHSTTHRCSVTTKSILHPESFMFMRMANLHGGLHTWS